MRQPASVIIELSGHIIDSLTLAKVIDTIHEAGCPYQIDDLQVGEKKHDFSYAQISLWPDGDPSALDHLLAELRVYGATPVLTQDATLMACPADGQLPPNAYIRKNPPTEIYYQGDWMSVKREGQDHVLVVNTETHQAELVPVKTVKRGQQVVVGTRGIRILPTLDNE